MDTTCLEANVHFPTDWVLLRDAARTVMKATILIRKRGICERMEAPGVIKSGIRLRRTITGVARGP